MVHIVHSLLPNTGLLHTVLPLLAHAFKSLERQCCGWEIYNPYIEICFSSIIYNQRMRKVTQIPILIVEYAYSGS